MDEKEIAVETEVQTAATEQSLEDDYEARISTLEEEKNKLIEENANWKVAALKYKQKSKEDDLDESDEDKFRRIAREAVAESRLVEIAREQDELIKRALKENKELKLAQMNKEQAAPPAAMGSHSEAMPVMDTSVTPEQLSALKARGWSDKDIERYKKNLQRYGGR